MNTYKCKSITDGDDEYEEISSYNPWLAAGEFMKQRENDQAEYPVGSGELSATVEVVDAKGVITLFEVHGCLDPTYCAYEVTTDD